MSDLPHPRQGLYLARDVARLGNDTRVLSVGAARGEFVKIRRGAYVSAEHWQTIQPRERHVMSIRAVDLAAAESPIFSHRSAAAVWGLPLLGSWAHPVHEVVPLSGGGRSSPGIVRHGVRMNQVSVTERAGMLVTSIERTLLDLALTESFASAVMACDAALSTDLGRERPLTTKERLRAELSRFAPRSAARAERVIDFADGDSGSPGESLSRVRFHELGFPAPLLQVEFIHHTGITDRADFFWPKYGHIGESDGLSKYRDPRLMNGRSPDEVVIEEKRREDRLRSQQPRFSRWEWLDAFYPQRLLAILLDAGLPRIHARPR